jgi:hypothetical protein
MRVLRRLRKCDVSRGVRSLSLSRGKREVERLTPTSPTTKPHRPITPKYLLLIDPRRDSVHNRRRILSTRRQPHNVRSPAWMGRLEGQSRDVTCKER